MKNIFLLLFYFFACPAVGISQDFSGEWKGELTQKGKSDTFLYTVNLRQNGDKVEGTAASEGKNGGVTAKFILGGVWDGASMTLQEVQQTEPPKSRWCLKHIRLTIKNLDGVAALVGDWEAEGCQPGNLVLKNEKFPLSDIPAVHKTEKSLEKSSPFPGKWTGFLSQSDRDYGFYFELILAADGTGISHIISDGQGGNATHQLNWKFDAATGELHFEETGITEKSVPSWRWCIKSGDLFFNREENRLSMLGNWSGYIEGYTAETGPCAAGKLYVEKPLFKKDDLLPYPVQAGENEAPKPAGVADYKKNEGRNVEIERILEVKNKTVKIRVWDNGTVDGDVLSLFLNGEQLLKNYRVTRQKKEIIVQLEKPVNYIILHAIDLGNISPNTVAVSVYDGVQEQVVIISSNLKTSGAIMIREFSVK
jgi:hypothetical protein